jgi:hypothetical protein
MGHRISTTFTLASANPLPSSELALGARDILGAGALGLFKRTREEIVIVVYTSFII